MQLEICKWMLVGILGMSTFCYAETESNKPSIETVKKETQNLLKSIRSYSVDKKDEAVQKAKEGLSKLDKMIASQQGKLDKNWDNMNEAAREQAAENLTALREQRDQVSTWYSSMKTSSVDTWQRMKKGYSDGYNALEESWEESGK
jgi:thioesterase domain-containing protein